MLPHPPLSRLFGNAPARVLEALLRSDGMTVRQVARVAALAPGTASSALRRLEQQWIVVSRPVGSALQFHVNDQHYAVWPLRQLLEAADHEARGLPDLILSILGSVPRSVIVFGSAARGDGTEESDVDLVVVAHSDQQLEWWRRQVDDLGEALARRLGGPLDAVMVGPPTRTDLRRPFWRAVIRDGHLLAGQPLSP